MEPTTSIGASLAWMAESLSKPGQPGLDTVMFSFSTQPGAQATEGGGSEALTAGERHLAGAEAPCDHSSGDISICCTCGPSGPGKHESVPSDSIQLLFWAYKVETVWCEQKQQHTYSCIATS